MAGGGLLARVLKSDRRRPSYQERKHASLQGMRDAPKATRVFAKRATEGG